jgi:hypothetical protein
LSTAKTENLQVFPVFVPFFSVFIGFYPQTIRSDL